ncbi:MAG TPA: hypothetical protein VGI20_03640 [Rhizomicrobium sp.]|jgi:hypothetical protein
MNWMDEAAAKDQSLVHRALMLEVQDSLLLAYTDFWKRILTDGCATAESSDWASLSFDILDRQVEGDEQGYMHAMFRNGVKKPARGLGQYFVRGVAFDCIQPRGEDNNTFNKRQIRWLLKHYGVLKEAAKSAEMLPLFERFGRSRGCPITAATSYGWFDLQLGRDSFGPLPSEDEAMLAGNDPPPVSPLKDLLGGIMEFE